MTQTPFAPLRQDAVQGLFLALPLRRLHRVFFVAPIGAMRAQREIPSGAQLLPPHRRRARRLGASAIPGRTPSAALVQDLIPCREGRCRPARPALNFESGGLNSLIRKTAREAPEG